MGIDADWLDTIHDHVIRHTFLPKHLALEGTGDEVDEHQHLLVRRVSADRVSVGHIEIHTRSFERSKIAVEPVGYDQYSVYLTLLHRVTCLGIVIGDQLDVHRRRCLHLVHQTAGDGALVMIDNRHRHLFRCTGFHQRHKEEQRDEERPDG